MDFQALNKGKPWTGSDAELHSPVWSREGPTAHMPLLAAERQLCPLLAWLMLLSHLRWLDWEHHPSFNLHFPWEVRGADLCVVSGAAFLLSLVLAGTKKNLLFLAEWETSTECKCASPFSFACNITVSLPFLEVLIFVEWIQHQFRPFYKILLILQAGDYSPQERLKHVCGYKYNCWIDLLFVIYAVWPH